MPFNLFVSDDTVLIIFANYIEYYFIVKFRSSRTGAYFKVIGNPAGNSVFNLIERT
jgi:hypothetical protein